MQIGDLVYPFLDNPSGVPDRTVGLFLGTEVVYRSRMFETRVRVLCDSVVLSVPLHQLTIVPMEGSS
jgi:hypothetical protein